ncbi:MAG: HAD family hydrolase [Bacillota bacterium]|jgi:pyrophosphatase PpaX
MPIDTLLFDLDGTVTNSIPLIKNTYQLVFQEMGIPWGSDDVMKLIGLPLREIGRIMAGDGKEEDFYQAYQVHYRLLHHKYMSLFPGTVRLLTILKKKHYSLGIVTSKSRYGTEMTLSYLNIAHFFKVVVTADDTNLHKPHPEPVLFALDKIGKKPEQAAYIGDTPYDIAAGNRATTATVGVTWGMAGKNELEKQNPTIIVHSKSTLLNWLKYV